MPRRFSLQEYLMLEERSESRNEFHDGEIFAMAGGTLEHNQIQGNFYRAVAEALEGGPCRVYSADVRLLVERYSLVTYPDALVICGAPRRLAGRQDTVTDATLIAEILSPSTRDNDRGDKFLFYRSLSSLTEYILIEQSEARVERHSRQDSGEWLMTEWTSLEESVELLSVKVPIPLSKLYRYVEL